MTTPKQIIDTLIALRKAKGWTQSELAKRSGLTQPLIARFENHINLPSLKNLCKLINALDASLVLSELQQDDKSKS